MIPRSLLRGTPIQFHDVEEGDIIDTWSPDRQEKSRFHRRLNQRVTNAGESCDINTDYDMICVHLGLWIQLIHRPKDTE